MSKITQALEKAARERLKQLEQRPTAPSAAVSVALTPPSDGPVATAVDHVNLDPHLVSMTDVKSPIAEQYRILKANFQSQRGRDNIKIIVVTSAMRAEGKTVTSLNLALTLARDEQLRVALVDGDMRKGSINRWLGLDESPTGLSTVLRGGGVLNGSLLKLQSPPLTILPAGPIPDDPAGLLESSAMKRLIATLKAQFDLVIIDAPPVMAVADPGILASQADAALLVVRAGKTQRKTILQAQHRLQQMKVDVMGCVLTHMEYYMPGYYRYYQEYKKEKLQRDGRTLSLSAN